MIVSSRIVDYINSLAEYNSDYIEDIRVRAIADNVPIIRRESESLIKSLLYMKQPEKILEVGTAVAYSTLVMAEAMRGKASIITIENYEKRIDIAKKHIAESKYGSSIRLIAEDAAKALQDLVNEQESFDFIFMDAAKAQYINWLPMIIKLMSERAVLCSDNVLQDGDIVQSRYVIERRDRSMHSRLRKYLYKITHSDELSTSILAIGDGVAISVLKKI